MFNELSKQIYQANVEKGFYDEVKTISQVINLIHSELSEVIEAGRKGRRCNSPAMLIGDYPPDNLFMTAYNYEIKGSVEEELADVIIRLLDLCGWKEIDIHSHIKAKLKYNSLRPYKHGKIY